MKLIYLILLAVLVAGCGGGDAKRKLQILDRAINEYAQAMRWARYDDAQQFHLTPDGERARFDVDALKHVRVTGYAIREREVSEDVLTADVDGELEYFLDSRGTLQRLPLKQKWWFEPKLKRWYLESDPPRF